MFDGVVLAPARLLGKQKFANPINEQGNLPLAGRNIVLTDRFDDLVGKKAHAGPRHIHDSEIITSFNNSNRLKDVTYQMIRYKTDMYNLVALPFTEPLPTFDGPVVNE